MRRPEPVVAAPALEPALALASAGQSGRAQIAALETWARLEEELALLEAAAARARADLAAGRTGWAAKLLSREGDALDRIAAVREALQERE